MIRFVYLPPIEFPLHVLGIIFELLCYTQLPISTHFLAMGTGMKRQLVGVTAFENSDLLG